MFARSLPLLAVFFVYNAQAAWKGDISFTQAEKDAHARSVQVIAGAASACLDADLARQQKVWSQYGVSPFFGDRSTFSKETDQEKLNELYSAFLSLGHNQNEAQNLAQMFLKMMEPTSCVGLTLKCLGKGFEAAGQQDVWARIKAYTAGNGDDGTSLQNALQLLGWRVLYWNPWTQFNAQWDATEQANDPDNQNRFWGFHAYRWATVQKSQLYYWNHVDDYRTLVDFGTTVPASVTKVPFFVGTAHTGYHVFPGHFGQVVEGHSTRVVTDSQTIQTAPFNPLQTGGAPRGQYYSGLIAVPPGY